MNYSNSDILLCAETWLSSLFRVKWQLALVDSPASSICPWPAQLSKHETELMQHLYCRPCERRHVLQPNRVPAVNKYSPALKVYQLLGSCCVPDPDPIDFPLKGAGKDTAGRTRETSSEEKRQHWSVFHAPLLFKCNAEAATCCRIATKPLC